MSSNPHHPPLAGSRDVAQPASPELQHESAGRSPAATPAQADRSPSPISGWETGSGGEGAGRLVFITGGARSGKSRHAEELAAASGRPVTYIATMTPGDPELQARVERHRARRPASWTTVEAPLDVSTELERVPHGHIVLLDCLSLWVSNRLFAEIPDIEAASTNAWEAFVASSDAAAGELVTRQEALGLDLLVVTNEIGLGVVPDSALGRYYRDALGLVNQRIARAAAEAVLMVSGLPVRLKCDPAE